LVLIVGIFLFPEIASYLPGLVFNTGPG